MARPRTNANAYQARRRTAQEQARAETLERFQALQAITAHWARSASDEQQEVEGASAPMDRASVQTHHEPQPCRAVGQPTDPVTPEG